MINNDIYCIFFTINIFKISFVLCFLYQNNCTIIMKKVLDIFIQNLARKKSDKSETSNTSCNTNPVLKSQVSSGQPMNIAALLSENSTMREICEDFINYLNSQCQNIDNTISAGECAHNIAQHLGREKSKMVEAIKILSDKAIFLDNQSSIAVSKRSFLPIHPIPFAEFSSFTVFSSLTSKTFCSFPRKRKLAMMNTIRMMAN